MSNHPITLPPELRRSWLDEAWHKYPDNLSAWIEYVAEKSAQWGADQELEACCEWTAIVGGADALRAARRPKPPSLKEQALEQLRDLQKCGAGHRDTDKIRQALEAL
jgi:hypothetical protein